MGWHYSRRDAGMGQDALTFAVQGVADKIVAALLPRLKPIVKAAAEAAEPTIRTVIREEVMPKVAAYGGIGLLGVAALAAVIGAAMARRGSR
jgi:hypothetical protein